MENLWKTLLFGPFGFHNFSEPTLYMTRPPLDCTVLDTTALQFYLITITTVYLSSTAALFATGSHVHYGLFLTPLIAFSPLLSAQSQPLEPVSQPDFSFSPDLIFPDSSLSQDINLHHTWLTSLVPPIYLAVSPVYTTSALYCITTRLFFKSDSIRLDSNLISLICGI